MRVIEKTSAGPRAATLDEHDRIMQAIAQESMVRSRVQTLPDSMYIDLKRHVREASIAVFDKCIPPKYVILWSEGSVTILTENIAGDLAVVVDTTG